jgi:hypothetical protein
VLHACGRRDEAAVRSAWRAADPESRGLLVRVVAFIDRMDLAYAAADLAVTRSGAMTMAELTAVGMPAVMVPLPHAAAGHQTANARAAADAGGARVIDDALLDGPTLAATAAPLLAEPGELARMGKAMLGLARPRAAEELAGLVLAALPPGKRPPVATGGAEGAADLGTTQEFVDWFGSERASPRRPAPRETGPPAGPGLGLTGTPGAGAAAGKGRASDQPDESGTDLGSTAEFEAWYRDDGQREEER